MQERPEYAAAPAALGAEVASGGIATVEQGIARTFPMQHRIVKLVAAEGRAAAAKVTIDSELGRAIAKMQTPFGKRGLDRQEAGHGMALPLGIDQPLAQDHVAAALAEQ